MSKSITRKSKLLLAKRNARIRSAKYTYLKKLFFLAIILIIGYLSFFQTSNFLPARLIRDSFYKVTALNGLVVSNVYLDGHKNAGYENIVNSLNFKIKDPILSIDLIKLKKNIEEVSWVKSVIIRRKLPHNIYIYIEEKKPIAIMQQNGKLFLIDENLLIINEPNINKFSYLPILIADNLEDYSNILYKILIQNQSIYSKISAIIRVSDRRWNIRFKNGPEIKLPEYDIEFAWQKVIDLYKSSELFNDQVKTIDLRIPNKIFIEKN